MTATVPSVPIDPLPFNVDVLDGAADSSLMVVSGDVDLVGLSALQDALCRMVRPGARGRVLVDLGRITFLAACAASWMVHAQHQVGASGRTLSVVGASDFQRRVLAAAGFRLDAGSPATDD